MSFSVLNNAQNRKYSYFFLPHSASSSSYNPPMRQLFLLVPLLLLLGCSGKTEVVTHYSDGMIKTKGYFDSEESKTGVWTNWDENGQKINSLTYKEGILEGPFSGIRMVGRGKKGLIEKV